MQLTRPRVVPDSEFLNWRAPLVAAWRWRWTKYLIALAMLAAIYWAADWRAVGRSLLHLNMRWLAAGLGMFVVQSLVSALRWQNLVSGFSPISLGEAARHTLMASAGNLIVPAKLGDFSKAAMLPPPRDGLYSRGTLAVIREKVADVAALCGWMLWGAAGFGMDTLFFAIQCLAVVALALMFLAAKTTLVRRTVPLVLYSLCLWWLHLVQIDFFLKAAGVFVEPPTALARLPVAIFAGLLPLSFCGIGTRDSALIWLFSDVAPASTMAVVGLLTALRYIIPGLAGIVVLGTWTHPMQNVLVIGRIVDPDSIAEAHSRKAAKQF